MMGMSKHGTTGKRHFLHDRDECLNRLQNKSQGPFEDAAEAEKTDIIHSET